MKLITIRVICRVKMPPLKGLIQVMSHYFPTAGAVGQMTAPLTGLKNGCQMRVQYFEDTDTIYIVFKEAEVNESKDLDENTLVEFDVQGNLVSMTVEHARERADIPNFSFQQVLTSDQSRKSA